MRKKVKIFTPDEHEALIAALEAQEQPPPKTALTIKDMLAGPLGSLLLVRKNQGWKVRDMVTWLEGQGVTVAPRTLSMALQTLENSQIQERIFPSKKQEAPEAKFLNAEEDDL